MTYILICIGVFLAAYTLNLLYVTVFYHRALTHQAVTLHPWLQKIVQFTGNWVTGLDPKGWSCMHRLHHKFSDTSEDPHSPVYKGMFKLFLVQLKSYKKTLKGLIQNQKYYTAMVTDLKFPVSWLNRYKLWFLPYLMHLAIALFIALFFHAYLLAACYYIGIMSHPIQGWMVNALGHRFGYRNFSTNDNSRNNTAVAWLVFGEGFQNNHHQQPSSPKFSVRWWELDMGYWLCCVLKFFGLVSFQRVPSRRHVH